MLDACFVKYLYQKMSIYPLYHLSIHSIIFYKSIKNDWKLETNSDFMKENILMKHCQKMLHIISSNTFKLHWHYKTVIHQVEWLKEKEPAIQDIGTHARWWKFKLLKTTL